MIEVLRTGGMTTVQDLGRAGHRAVGVGLSGPLDALAARAGNALLGNDPGCAFIEAALLPLRLRFTVDTRIAITGADGQATLDGRPLLPWWTLPVRAGQELNLAAPSHGSVVYVCVAGGIDVQTVMGSRSTDLKGGFGGLEGRPLRKGDVLPVAAAPGGSRATGLAERGFGVRPPEDAGPVTTVRILPAAEWSQFTAEARSLLLETDWEVTPQSNRIGVRLDGPELRLQRPLEMLSHGIVPGVVQVPPAGRPIVLQCDAQTSGGYPKIATVIEADQWRVAQTPPGGRLRFELASLDQAHAARRQQRSYLQAIERAARSATLIC